MEGLSSDSNSPPPSRAKLLEMWKASRGRARASRVHDAGPAPSQAQTIRKPSVNETWTKPGLKDVFDHRGATRAKSPPLISPMKPEGARDFGRRFLGKNAVTTDRTLSHSHLNKDPMMQSLAEKVSSLFPSSALKPHTNTEHNENLQNNDIPNESLTPSSMRSGMGAKVRVSLKNSKPERSTSPTHVQGDVTQDTMQSYVNIRDSLNVTEEVLKAYLEELAYLRAKDVESENRLQMAAEEQEAVNFLLEVQNQKIREFETAISSSRLRQNEIISEKNRKHKAEIRRMSKERADYEAQTNQVITQLNEQLNSLQTMAMARIEVP